MAFIREYQAVSAMQGDPFFLGLRRRLGKIGRGVVRGGIGRFVGRAAGLVPGVGQALQLARAAGLSAGDFEDDDDLMEWARSYGYDQGDPKPPKRKQAAAGGKAKAARKRVVRRERRRGPGRVERGLSALGRGLGGIAQHLPGLAGAAGSILQQASGTGIQDDLAAAAGGLPDAGMVGVGAAPAGALRGRARVARMTKRGTMTFRKRPSMQPTNTRALNRALRRVEGFKHVVSRVYKALPALRPHTRTSARGHKAGCKCATCR